MKDRTEKTILYISTLCILLFLGFFVYLVLSGKKVVFRGVPLGVQSIKESFSINDDLRKSSLGTFQNQSDVATVFFGGRIITNPSSWEAVRTNQYSCPALIMTAKNGLEKTPIMTIVDIAFCDGKKVVVEKTYDIIPRANLLFYIHTNDSAYGETIDLILETVQ